MLEAYNPYLKFSMDSFIGRHDHHTESEMRVTGRSDANIGANIGSDNSWHF